MIETDERSLISGVLRLGDRAVRGVMTPRTDVDWIDLEHDAGRHPRSSDDAAFAPAGRRGYARQHARHRPVARLLAGAALAASRSTSGRRPPGAGHARHDRRARRPRGPAPGRGADGARPRRIRPFRGPRDPGRHPRRHRRRLPLRRGAARSRKPSSARTAPGCSPAGCRPTRWPTSSASSCRHAATTRPSPASSSASCSTCRTPASTSTTLGWRFEVVDLDGRRIDKVLVSRIPAETEPRAGLAV